MSTFWKPFLAKVSENDRIAVTYKDNDALISVQGVVVGTDKESFLAVMSDGGSFPHGIRFDTVEAFRPLGISAPPAVSADNESENKNTTGGAIRSDGQGVTPPPPPTQSSTKESPFTYSATKKEPPLHQQKPSVLTLNLRDDELRNLFLSLKRDEKRVLGPHYNGFNSHSRVRNLDRMADAAKKMSAVISTEYHAGYNWPSQALLLCGGMLYRARAGFTGINANYYDPGLFVYRGTTMFPEAAYYAYIMQDYTYAAAYAMLALEKAVPEIERDLIIIIAKSVYETRDLSAFPFLKEKIGDRYDALTASMLRGFLNDCGVNVDPAMSCDKMLSILATQYEGHVITEEGRTIHDVIQEFIEVEEFEDESVPESNSGNPDLQYEDTAPSGVPETMHPANLGWISSVDYNSSRGEITCTGRTYHFRYHQIQDQDVKNRVQRCYRPKLEGSTCWVYFDIADGDAHNIVSAKSPLKQAGLAADANNFRKAIDCCMETQGSPDLTEGLTRVVEYAVTAYRKTDDDSLLCAAEQFYSQNYDAYSQTARPLSFVAQMYYSMGNNHKAQEYMYQALSCRDLSLRMRSTFLFYYVRYCQNTLNDNYDAEICRKCIEKATEWLVLFNADEAIHSDEAVRKNYPYVINCRCQAEAMLGQLDEAESDFRLLSESSYITEELSYELERRRADIAEQKNKDEEIQEPAEESHSYSDSEYSSDLLEVLSIPDGNGSGLLASVEDDEPVTFAEADSDDDNSDEDVIPYDDRDGWPELHLSEKDVIDYALSIIGEQAVPYALTYLRAAASLNPKLNHFYELLALSANDPSYAADYSIAKLFTMLDAVDASYQELHDYCMSSAYLRTSFQADHGYDYNARSLRKSISLLQSDDTLCAICDLLEEFREKTKMAMDIYADYRRQDAIKLKEAQDALRQNAKNLYDQYVKSPPRDSLLSVAQTKLLLFAKDGFLAQMLRAIISQDHTELEAKRDAFAKKFLHENTKISESSISSSKIDSMIDEYWERTGREKFGREFSGPIQGARKNNLRSAIKDVAKVICAWYALAGQNAGFSYMTEDGEALYGRLKPRMIELLDRAHSSCLGKLAVPVSAQQRMGLYIVDRTVCELKQRLNGAWRFGNEKYMFVDFLRRDEIMLDKDFLPELSSTFCILPGFNILARIRAHIEGEKPAFEERISQIFSADRFRNNYGCSDRIFQYFAELGQDEVLRIPENAELYLSQTKKQTRGWYRSFLETYALAVNYGQIMQSDVFCYTLEDTVKYWYHYALETHNYGFFNTILRDAEEQIHISAKQYMVILDEQLDALISNNQAEFDKNPGYEAAIREQISQQNFIVAEDWMNRIRAHDFSLLLQQPTALTLLDHFWFECGQLYQQVFEVEKTLEQNLIQKKHVFSSESAFRLIHSWAGADRVMDVDRITTVLNLLGWPDIAVTEVSESGLNDEIYYVKQNPKAINRSALSHPIAAFGSGVTIAGMYVVCLYGPYNADSLYEKICALDKLGGNKIIFLDCAIGATERHVIAQKMKRRESGIKNVYLLLDRVALCFLADNYSEDLVNRDLMAIGIPFSYCMPYVASSIHIMPPEIFIGRKHELAEVESPNGVNLIFGGRQLGKTALLRRAKENIDGDQGRRAVNVDINHCDCAASAQKLSKELAESGILREDDVTNDWGALCSSLLRTLKNGEEIKYLLIMLDEADKFIEDCGASNYYPIVKLKDVQQSLPGRFKFVLAGLHNIVRFNHEIAIGNNSVITHMPFLKVTPFKAPEAEELLRMPLSFLGLSLPSKVTVSQILATVNYFPGLIQLYAQKLIESLCTSEYAGYDPRHTPPYVITDDHLRRVMADKEFVGEIHAKFDATLMLDEDHGYCYYPIALIFGWLYYEDEQKAKQAGFSAEDILEQAKEFNISQIISLDKDRINTLLSELEDLNILRSISNDTYLLASKNFRDLLGSQIEILESLSKIGGAHS